MTKYNDRPVNRMFARAHTITVNFPHASQGLNPSIHFYEQNVIEDAEGNEHVLPDTVSQAGLEVAPESFGTTFQLRDLITEEDIPGATATYGEFATMLYSLYFHAAQERDEQVAAEAAANVLVEGEPVDAGMGPDGI